MHTDGSLSDFAYDFGEKAFSSNCARETITPRKFQIIFLGIIIPASAQSETSVCIVCSRSTYARLLSSK